LKFTLLSTIVFYRVTSGVQRIVNYAHLLTGEIRLVSFVVYAISLIPARPNNASVYQSSARVRVSDSSELASLCRGGTSIPNVIRANLYPPVTRFSLLYELHRVDVWMPPNDRIHYADRLGGRATSDYKLRRICVETRCACILLFRDCIGAFEHVRRRLYTRMLFQCDSLLCTADPNHID